MQKIEDILIVIESSELESQSFLESVESAHDSINKNIPATDIVRIEGNSTFSWSGVRNCNTDTTAQREYKKSLEKWVKNQMFEHRNWRWVRYGATEAKGRCSQTTDTWTNVTSCGCSGILKCFIEFRKP